MVPIDIWQQSRALIWQAAAWLFIICCLGSAIAGVYPSWFNVLLLSIPVSVCGSVVIAYHGRHDLANIVICAEAMTILLIIMAVGGLLTYPAASVGFPYADDLLEHADRLLGFEWIAFSRFVDRSAFVCRLLQLAYGSIEVQPIVVVFALIWSGHVRRLQRFLIAIVISLCVTAVGLVFFPAVSAFAHYGVTEQTFVHIRPANDDAHVAIIAALRQGRLNVIGAQALTGMVTFPSFHACAAFFFVWAAAPIRKLFVFMLPLNVAMLIATPVFGAHYLVDVIAGLVLAIAAIRMSGVILSFHQNGSEAPASEAMSGNIGQAAIQ